MNGEPNNPDDNEDEAGEPLAILADFQQEPSPHFLGRIRKKIDRRITASNVVAIGWHLPRLVLVEFLDMIFHVFGSHNPQKGDKP
jgi:hypothetical protein